VHVLHVCCKANKLSLNIDKTIVRPNIKIQFFSTRFFPSLQLPPSAVGQVVPPNIQPSKVVLQAIVGQKSSEMEKNRGKNNILIL
jgi:hypothetical protein